MRKPGAGANRARTENIMSIIINRTPHDITIMPLGATISDPPVAVLPAAKRGEVARVEQTTIRDGRCISLDAPSIASRHPDLPPDVAAAFAEDLDELDGVEDGRQHIPIGRAAWGQVVGLPAPESGIYHVVSVIVAEAAVDAGRTIDDLLVPGDQVRDDKGRIVGCRGLFEAVTASPAMSGQRAAKAADAIHRRLDPECDNLRPHPEALVVEAERLLQRCDREVSENGRLRLLGGFAYDATEAHGALRVAVLGMCRRVVGEVLSDLDLDAEEARMRVVDAVVKALVHGPNLPMGRSGHDYVAGWPGRSVTPPPTPK